MNRISAFKLFVEDQEAAKRFYVEKLGFVVAEDERLGDFRWLLVRPRGNKEVAIHLALATSLEHKTLIGSQAGNEPFFGITTDDCRGDYAELKRRGVKFEGEPQEMPFGTGVMMQDLYGNKIYLNEDPVPAKSNLG